MLARFRAREHRSTINAQIAAAAQSVCIDCYHPNEDHNQRRHLAPCSSCKRMSYAGGGYAGYGDGGYYGEGGYNEQGAFPQQQAATGSFYPEQHQQQQQSFAGWEAPSYSTPQTSDGYYFAVDVLETGGAPINSLAYDQHFEALYVASKVTRGRQSSSQLSTHLPDGQLYASVLAHPPASPSIRETLPNSDANFLSLTPLPHGMVLSTSLAGARLHTPGGLPVAHCAHEGLACATASAYGIVVGGWEQALLLDATLQKVRTYRCPNVTLTCMATSSSTVVGGSDGNVRLLDAHVRQVAQVPSHPGGVGSIAVSPDGTLFATTGQHLDPTVLLYDIRYLGRRGIPHAFSGLGGGPKHVQFLPDVEGLPTNRLLVGSGLSGGGLEIIVPFEEASGNKDNYMIPPLERGDRVAAMALWEDQLSLGTARGKIYRYQMQGYSNPTRRQTLEIPSFYPEPPALSLGTESLKHGESQSIAGSYALTTEPLVSAISKDSPLTGVFGKASHIPVIGGSRLTIPSSTLAKASHVMDFLRTIPTSSLGVDLSLDHRPEAIKARMKGARKNPLENPNKLLYTDSIYHDVYGESLNRNKKSGRKSRRGAGGEEGVELPRRYKLTLRPANKSVAAFGYVDYNDFGLLPGWDYPPTMPNAFIPSVLMLLYLVPEIRNSLLEGVLVGDRASFLLKEKLLTPELAFVFHRIETLYQNGMVFPTAQRDNVVPRVHAWSPSNFIACLTSMPEAEQLQILDGSPAAVDTPRRAEAFFRFLIYQLDKEMGKARSLKPIESLSGMSFTSINTFVSQTSDPTFSSSQALTVDLVYDGLAEKASFSAVLKNSLHRVKRLPSYNCNTGGYETIVQRKVATSLPEMLSISCACAGRKEEEGLRVWRGTDAAWLPEFLEVSLAENGDVSIREGSRSGDSADIEWTAATPITDLPAFDSNTLKEARSKGTILKRQYRLEYVLSLVRDDMDRDCPAAFTEMENDDKFGHHVLHARVTKQQQGTLLREQRAVLEGALGLDLDSEQGRSTTIGGDSTIASFEERIQHIDGQLAKLDGENADDAWVLFNGFAVSSTVSEDARSFYPKFKEPSLGTQNGYEAALLCSPFSPSCLQSYFVL